MNTEGPSIVTEPFRKNPFRRGRVKRDLAALLLALAIPLTGCAAFGADQEPSSDTSASDTSASGSGPELTVTSDELAEALDCSEGPDDSEAAPVLLIPLTVAEEPEFT